VKEIAMAQRLIDTLSCDWSAAAHEDRYREAVLELIERKAAGQELESPSPQATPPRDDLLAALEQSLDLRSRKSSSKRRPDHHRGADLSSATPKTRARR
jgi:DNA end-binding protein Ku